MDIVGDTDQKTRVIVNIPRTIPYSHFQLGKLHYLTSGKVQTLLLKLGPSSKGHKKLIMFNILTEFYFRHLFHCQFLSSPSFSSLKKKIFFY